MAKQIGKTIKRLFAVLLAVAMVFAAMPMNAIAVTDSGVNADGYIEVRTIEDLYNIRNDLTANYILMNDIDLTAATAQGGEWDFDGRGWNPIGSNDVYGSGAFSGIFDGNGHSIIGMRIEYTSSTKPSGMGENAFAGLFSKITGELRNLSMKNVNIVNCYAKAYIYVGAIAGVNNGIITCCSVSGTIKGSSDWGGYAGGISGSNSGTISVCFNEATVSCYGKSNSYSGGICAEGGNIINCYNAGTVSANYSNSGGICVDSKSVQNCYSIGKASYAISNSSSTTITGSYYLTGSGTGSKGATSLTETQMKIKSMYKGFDFENVWVINEFANYPYPQLRDNVQDLSESAEMVSIISLPENTNYYIGDKIDFTGGIVKVVYVSGREEIINITEDIVSGFNMNVAGEQTVTVSVSGASDNYKINVAERPVVKDVSIILEPNVKKFVVGSAFDFTGTKALVNYVGGTSQYIDISVDMTTGGDINHIGKQTITYSIGGKSATFEIEVVGIELKEIKLTSLPDKTTYLEGEDLDLNGMVLTAVMNNGMENTVGSGYTVSGYSSTPGKHTVVVSYRGKNVTFDVTVENRTLVSVSLGALPDKLEYISGEAFDDTGMQLIATYDNGDVEVAENYTVSGFDAEVGIKNVTVSMDGKSVSFPVKIIARVITEFKIASLPSKTKYIEFESLNTEGLVVEATYNDGKTETITDYELVGFSSNVGTHTVSVVYDGFVETFDILVVPRVLESIKVTAPEKISYIVGEKFDTTGLVVKACYDNGQIIIVDDYEISGFDSTTIGAKTITVTYGDMSYSFAVVVAERSAIVTEGNMIVGNVVGRLGETVVVPVTVTKNTGIAGFAHTVNFDATALKLVSVDAAGGYADGTLILNDENAANGKATVLWFGNDDVKGDGLVYNLTFEILETAKDGNSEITVSFDDNGNGNVSGENVIFGTIGGFVEVRSYWLGDLNGDRKFAMVDLLQLAQYVSGKAMTLTEKQMLSADVNEDGAIDIHDVIMLNQWLLEEEI